MSDHRTTSDIHPCLTYDDASTAIDWLCRVFGFAKRLVVPGPDNRIEHAELSLGTGVVMVSSPKPELGRVGPRTDGGAPVTLSVCIADPDLHHARAVAGGARVTQPLRDEPYGSRGYMADDIEGHHWYFGTYRPGVHWESS